MTITSGLTSFIYYVSSISALQWAIIIMGTWLVLCISVVAYLNWTDRR